MPQDADGHEVSPGDIVTIRARVLHLWECMDGSDLCVQILRADGTPAIDAFSGSPRIQIAAEWIQVDHSDSPERDVDADDELPTLRSLRGIACREA